MHPIRTYRQSAEKYEGHEEGVKTHKAWVFAGDVRVIKVVRAIRRRRRLVPLEDERLIDLS